MNFIGVSPFYCLEAERLFDLADTYHTPYYLYDEASLRKLATNLLDNSIFRNPSNFVYFACFSNSNPWLLEILKSCGMGVLVSSPAELFLAEAVGFSHDNIVVTGAPFTRSELVLFISHGLQLNLDSLSQIRLVAELQKDSRIGVRINLDCSLPCHELPINSCIGQQSRVGITELEILEVLQEARGLGVRVNCLHVYSGTNQHSDKFLREVFERLLKIAEGYKEIKQINLGGGFGVAYEANTEQFPWHKFVQFLDNKLHDFARKTGRQLKLVIEPGRIVIASSCILCAQVVDVKCRPNGSIIVTTDASMSVFPRPYIYKEKGAHRISLVRKEIRASSKISKCVSGVEQELTLPEIECLVCGNTLASGDMLGKVVLNKLPKSGDLVIIHDAGAYGYSMSSLFSGRIRPVELLNKNDKVICIRERDSLFALLERANYKATSHATIEQRASEHLLSCKQKNLLAAHLNKTEHLEETVSEID